MPEQLCVLAETTLAADSNAFERGAALLADARALATAQAVPMLGLGIATSAARLDRLRAGPARAVTALEAALAELPAEEQDVSGGGTEIAAAQRLLTHPGRGRGVRRRLWCDHCRLRAGGCAAGAGAGGRLGPTRAG